VEPSTYRPGPPIEVVGVETRVEWEADNSGNVPSLSTKTWLVIVFLAVQYCYVKVPRITNTRALCKSIM